MHRFYQRQSFFFSGFPDIDFEILDTVADGDRVAVRFRVTGTHRGEFQGIPASGRPINVQGMTLLHFRDGKISERWNQFDQIGLMQRYLSFVMKPLFSANHHWAIRMGEESLKLEIARRHAVTPGERTKIPAPPGPTFSFLLAKR